MSYNHLLFELGCEELPPKTLLKLSNALLENVTQGLHNAELTFTFSKAYATPRRLTIFIENLLNQQPDKTVQKRGPAIQAAFSPDGSPSKSALAFAQSCGVAFENLERLITEKGEWLAFNQAVQGQKTVDLIPDLLRQSITQLPIAKRMRWGNVNHEFVRPVHWTVLLYGENVIETEILGLKTGSISYGHRFHAPQKIEIDKPENYAELLKSQGHVIVDFQTRKDLIFQAAQVAAKAVNGIAHIEEDLLDEITALNEYPVPITGSFDKRFLALPAEVLITTMQENQKYFPVKNSDGDLLAHFITFSNIESSRPQSIQQGNERVVTPRLSDAEFFWKQDRKNPLSERIESLNNIVFQEKLGSLGDKTQRLVKLAEFIATHLNADVELAKRAALLSKTDLMTEMVGEFGNLQGTMGRYYALADGENPQVAIALEEQYFPKQAGGATPHSTIGQILALAEKIDTLTGIFSAGLIPTGDKDPYALRRAALGILRILIENHLKLDIYVLTAFALSLFHHAFDLDKTQSAVTDFIFERLKNYCLDKECSIDEFEAVFALKPAEPLDFMQRLNAVKTFRKLPEADSLAAANKRIRNLLRKSDSSVSDSFEQLIKPEEIALLNAAKKIQHEITPLLLKRDYQATFNCLATLRPEVDAFFDHVMVMCDDLTLRANRLGLLNFVSEQFLTCADISKLQS